MRLLHIGIFNDGEPQVSLRQALRNNSEFYVEYNHTSLSTQQIGDIMLQNVNQNNVDVIFLQIQAPNILPIDVLKELKERKIKVFNFSGDVRSPLPQWYLDVAPYCYTLFTNENDVNTIKSNGFDCEFFQVGYNECFYNTSGDKREEAQIVFFGNNYPNHYPLSNFRSNIVDMLFRVYPDRFKLYGGGWNIPSTNMNFKQIEEGSIYRGAKLGINLSHFDYSRYTSDRLFRIMACGCMCLSHKYTNIDVDFIDGVHLRTWTNENELASLIDYYLNHEEERKLIASNGEKLVKEYYTWEYRINKQLKNIINELDKRN
jgi:glycosyltransferase involved in cell wall biosynthesis